MSPRLTQAERIAQLNDRLRARVGVPVFAKFEPKPLGTIVMTRNVASLEWDDQVALWKAVRNFDAFSQDNDPHGERDFGAVTLESGESLFWKIDYYADANCDAGSEDPADPARSFRVLTLMLAEEY